MGRKVQLITQAEYAKHRGCSQVSVHKAVAAGRISLIGDRIDPAVADLQWQQNTRARARNVGATPSRGTDRAEASTPDASGGYATSRARREAAEASLAEAELAELRGELVRSDDVRRGIFEAARAFRDRLTASCSRLASEVAPLRSAEDCYDAISREHRQALEQMVAEMKGMVPVSVARDRTE